MVNRTIIGSISAIGVFAGALSGMVSADNYEHEAEFVCPRSSTLVPNYLLRKFNDEKALIDKLYNKVLELDLLEKKIPCLKNDLLSNQNIEKEKEIIEKKNRIKKEIKEKKESMRFMKNRIDTIRKDIKESVANSRLSGLIPFFPWTSIEEIQKIISEKEPDFFNVRSLALNTDYIDGCFEGVHPYIEATTMSGMREEYKNYDAKILDLKRTLFHSQQQSNRIVLIKKLASLWVAENILKEEITERKRWMNPSYHLQKVFEQLFLFSHDFR